MSSSQPSGLTFGCHCCRPGASKWQAFAFQLGITLIAAGMLVMLLTALRSFGAAELLGQVSDLTVAIMTVWIDTGVTS